jgi:hypothetical protein
MGVGERLSLRTLCMMLEYLCYLLAIPPPSLLLLDHTTGSRIITVFISTPSPPYLASSNTSSCLGVNPILAYSRLPTIEDSRKAGSLALSACSAPAPRLWCSGSVTRIWRTYLQSARYLNAVAHQLTIKGLCAHILQSYTCQVAHKILHGWLLGLFGPRYG